MSIKWRGKYKHKFFNFLKTTWFEKIEKLVFIFSSSLVSFLLDYTIASTVAFILFADETTAKAKTTAASPAKFPAIHARFVHFSVGCDDARRDGFALVRRADKSSSSSSWPSWHGLVVLYEMRQLKCQGHFCFIKGKRCRAAQFWASWILGPWSSLIRTNN